MPIVAFIIVQRMREQTDTNAPTLTTPMNWLSRSPAPPPEEETVTGGTGDELVLGEKADGQSTEDSADKVD